MKNKEKYFDELIDVVKSECTASLYKFKKMVNPEEFECRVISCQECNERFDRWLEQECREPIKLTDDEIVILKNIPDEYEWLIRFEKGGLVVCGVKPQRINTKWRIAPSMDLYLFNHLFQFIKPEDEEPYNIDELLKMNGVERYGKRMGKRF